MLDELIQRFSRKDRFALARLLTHLSRGEHVEAILRSLPITRQPGRVVAITGSGGVGKSSLIGKLIELFRARGRTIGVLACDPESPVSGGALLGDRFRMNPAADDGLFIRSLAAQGGQGALADHLDAMIEVLETFGFDLILIETAGAGQGDTRVRTLVDVVVLLLQPEAGDELQWEKAGLLEVADIVFIHKADLPGSEQVEAQVRGTLDLSAGKVPKVLRGSARTGQGLTELCDAIEACSLRPREFSALDKMLLQYAQETLARRYAAALADSQDHLSGLLEQWRGGNLKLEEAVVQLMALVAQRSQ
jgi:LAO/AO transport system ATPase